MTISTGTTRAARRAFYAAACGEDPTRPIAGTYGPCARTWAEEQARRERDDERRAAMRTAAAARVAEEQARIAARISAARIAAIERGPTARSAG